MIGRPALRRAVALLGLALVLWAIAAATAASVFSPQRTGVDIRLQARLDAPARFGLQVTRRDCLDDQVPCLLVGPDAGAGPAERGRLLRSQLAALGVPLRPYGEVVADVVLLHGRNSRKEHLLPIAERFAAAGFRCIIPDLPGHGDSPLAQTRFGATAFERQLPVRVLAEFRRERHLPQLPALLWGYSMGGAYAVQAAEGDPPPWRALVVVSSFDRLDAVVDARLAPTLGALAPAVGWLATHAPWSAAWQIPHIRPDRHAAQVRLPALVVHGTEDRLIPPARGRALLAALGSTDKQWVPVPGAGHQDVFVTDMPLFATMARWMLRQTDASAAADGQPSAATPAG